MYREIDREIKDIEIFFQTSFKRSKKEGHSGILC